MGNRVRLANEINPVTFVNRYCSILNNRIVRDHHLLFERAGADRLSFFLDAYAFLKMEYPKFYKMNALAQLGSLAAEVLLADGLLTTEYKPDQIGIVLSNANASLDADIDYLKSLKEIPSPSLFVYTLPNIVAGEICIRHQIKGENGFLILEKFDAPFLARYVSLVLNADDTRACLAGWIDVGRDGYEAFLYLVEKQKKGLGIEHTGENLIKLYLSE